MSLRNRLTFLLVLIAALTMLTASASFYGVYLRITDVIDSLDQSADEEEKVYRLRQLVREQVLQLEEIIDGQRTVSAAYSAGREEFFRRFRHAGELASSLENPSISEDVLFIARKMEEASDRCLRLVASGDRDRARKLLHDRIEGVLAKEAVSRIRGVERRMGEIRARAVSGIETTAEQVLFIIAGLGIIAATVVVVGAGLIRRWLFVPLQDLRRATEKFTNGEFDYRTTPVRDDELGRLGTALNTMAESVSDAQRRLTDSETKHRSLFENLRDAVVIADVDGHVVEYHDSDSGLLHLGDGDPVGRHILEVWPEWLDAVSGDWSSLIHGVITEGRWFRDVEVEIGHEHEDAHHAYVELIVYRVEYGQTRYAVIVLRDVTERHRLETRIRRAETTEAIGTLAGGLAHDFNNLLTSAIGTLSVMEEEDARSGSDLERIKTALRACWQAARLSRRLLNFASGAHGYPQVLRLREVVELILDSFDESTFAGIEKRTDLANDVLVKIDRDQLTQVVLNLVRNACDAMPEGGSLDVAIEVVTAQNPEESAPIRYALLTVRDTGVGMSPAAKKRVFEPFFTTKSRGMRRGRGMGMATVLAAVRGGNGFIQFDSEPGVGTTFRVYIPESEGVARVTGPEEALPPVRKGEGNVLVVDDDPMVLPVCQDLIEQWGYSVIAAESIADARGKFAPIAADIPLAVIDVQLSDGSGFDLAQDLLAMRGDLRVVFITGHSPRPVPAELDGHVIACLTKPFRLEELSAALSGALAAAKPPP
jgi:PAS domain S-box-containing protein